MAINVDGGRQAEKPLEPGHLLEIYREQFRHVRHLETTDSLGLALIGLFTLAIFVLIHLPFIKEEPHDVLVLILAAMFMLAGPGIYGATRRAAYRMRHLTIINRVGQAIGAVRAGVVPASIGSGLPRDMWDFWKRLIFGYRGPAIVFYSVLIWGTMFTGIFEMGFHGLHWPVVVTISLAVVLLFNLGSIWSSWAQLQQEMLTLKQEVELGTSLEKSLTEQLCDLADSMLRLRPPRLNEALEYYQKALAQEPDNSRAKEGATKLMSRRVGEFR